MLTQKAESNLRLLSLLNFLSGFRAFEGVMAVYFAAITGSFAVAMTALAVMNLSASFFEVPTGILSDRVGRKKTLIFYHLAAVLSVLLLYLSHSAELLFAGVIINGFAMAMRSGAVSAYVYENLEVLGRETEFKKQEGHRQSLNRYALVCAGILGTGIIFFFDIRTAVLLTFFVLLIALVSSFRLHDIHVSNPKTTNIYADIYTAWRSFKTNITLRDISIGQMIAQGGGNVEYRLRSLLFAGIMPEWLVNLLGMTNNLLTGVSMKYAHSVVEKFGIKSSLILLAIIDRIGTVIFVLINSVASAFGMSALSSAVFGIRVIAAEDVLQSHYSKDQRATMGSFVGLGSSLIYGVAGIGIGIMADSLGVINTMLIIQPFLLLSALFFYLGLRRFKNPVSI